MKKIVLLGLLGVFGLLSANDTKLVDILKGHEEVIDTLIDKKVETSDFIKLQERVRLLEQKIVTSETKKDEIYESKYDKKFKEYLEKRND